MSNARASTDEETAPLLDDPTTQAHTDDQEDHLTWADRARAMTWLETLLALVALFFLLLAAVFIGLFVGAENKLKHRPPSSGPTTTATATTTVHSTHTLPAPVPTKKPKPHEKTCTSRDCVIIAGEILQSIDDSVDPCEDFYQYANGGWLKSHSIPSDRGQYGSFNALQDSNRRIILQVLEGEDVKANKSDTPSEAANKANLRKLRTGYRACLDEKYLDKQGLEPLLDLVKEVTDILGPFLLDDQQESAEEIAEWDNTYDESYKLPLDWQMTNDQLYSAPPRRSAKLQARSLQETFADGDSHFSKERRKALTQALAFTHTRGIDALLGFVVEGDAGSDDPQLQGLSMYQTGGGLPSKEYYEEKPVLDFYTRVVHDILTALSHPKGKEGESDPEFWEWPWPWPKPQPQNPEDDEQRRQERLKSLAKQVVKFERSLIRAGADPEELFNPKTAYNPWTFKNLSHELDFMNLEDYISAYATRAFPEKIIVTFPPYIKSLRSILSSSPDHVVSAYFATRTALEYAKFLGPATPIHKATRKLHVLLTGIKKGVPEDRQQTCQAYADELEGLGLIGGKEFVEQTFGGDSKVKAERVIHNIIDAFKARLPDVPWMDKKSAKAAALKAENLYVKIGYPTTPNTTDALSLETYFAPLKIDGDFFANGLRQNILSVQRSAMQLGKRRDRGTWEMQPQLVNAYYSPPDGEIVFPAGILRDPFFSAESPLHQQYGAFGGVAAHELTHAFDNSGAQYDEHGRLRDWWTNTTVKEFEKRAQCVAQQYSQYSITGPDGKPVYINGNLTNGEDLGDSGIVLSYNAWKKAVKDEKEVYTKLPGLNFTDDQLFFLASSRVWAQLTTAETALARIRTDPHSPPEWRSNGQLRGFPKFAEAFHCKAGSPMNPKKRCEVW